MHGDVRAPNVVVREHPEGSTHVQVRFIDWDWAGREAIDRYLTPPNPYITGSLKRPPRVKTGAFLLQEDDIETLSISFGQSGESFPSCYLFKQVLVPLNCVFILEFSSW